MIHMRWMNKVNMRGMKSKARNLVLNCRLNLKKIRVMMMVVSIHSLVKDLKGLQVCKVSNLMMRLVEHMAVMMRKMKMMDQSSLNMDELILNMVRVLVDREMMIFHPFHH